MRFPFRVFEGVSKLVHLLVRHTKSQGSFTPLREGTLDPVQNFACPAPGNAEIGPAKICKIGGGFIFGLDRACGAQQRFQFDERRSGPATRFWRPAKNSRLVLKTQRTDTAGIVHCEQKINGLQWNGFRFLTGPADCLAAIGMVAQITPLAQPSGSVSAKAP